MLTSAELVWLLAAVAKGDRPAFERLYAATRAKLYGVALRILGRPPLAGEALQQAYLEIWRNAGQFDPAGADPLAWMVALVRRRAIDMRRKETPSSTEEGAEPTEVAEKPPDRPAPRALNEPLRRLLACMGRLEEDQRRLLLLAYYDGLSRDELAAKFGQPVETVRSRLLSAASQIRECLGS